MLLVSLLLSLCVQSSLSANILAVFPHPGKSHFDVFETLVLELASRGHQVTVVSFYPQKVPVKNLTDISLLNEAPLLLEIIKFTDVMDIGPIQNFVWVNFIGADTCKTLLKSQPILDLVKSGKKFDLLIVELFNSDCFLALSKIFSVPYIGFSSCNAFPHHNRRVANPDSLATVSNTFFPMSNKMSFMQRTLNVISTLGMQVAWTQWYARAEQKIVKEVLGEDIDLERASSEMSLLLVNTHYSLQGPRPVVPGFIEVGGMHITSAKRTPLVSVFKTI